MTHEAAHAWFGANRGSGWATGPLTENGLVRVLSNPAYPGASERPCQILERLRIFRASSHHVFWAEEVSLSDDRLFRLDLRFSRRQITDAYLLGLAKRMAGRLATFDRNIPLAAVLDATAEHLVALSL